METVLQTLIENQSKPLVPLKIESKLLPKIRQIKLANIKAVIFDVYGTILVSGAGDIGCKEIQSKDALWKTLENFNLTKKLSYKKEYLWELFYGLILKEHKKKRQINILYPEVDILDIWKRFLDFLGFQLTKKEIKKIALFYELIINPCWPMPDLKDVLKWLKQKNIFLGIISNAQFYTPIILETLLKKDLQSLGFDLNMCVWSYLEGRAKPDVFLFKKVEKYLAKYNCLSQEILYIGNDRLKDILPATKRGWKTLLFAGDKRSFRWREKTKELANCKPHGIITKLSQIKDILIS